jgi:hypothetical protein
MAISSSLRFVALAGGRLSHAPALCACNATFTTGLSPGSVHVFFFSVFEARKPALVVSFSHM